MPPPENAVVDRAAFMRWVETGELLSRDAAGKCTVNDSEGLARAVEIVEDAERQDDSPFQTETRPMARIMLTVGGKVVSEMKLSRDGWNEHSVAPKKKAKAQ